RGVRDALVEEHQHDEARNDERAVGDAVDLSHLGADRGAKDDEVERSRDHGGGDGLEQGPPRARHFEVVDCPYSVEVHDWSPLECAGGEDFLWTSPTKISSSELSLVRRSSKSTPPSASRRKSSETPTPSRPELKRYVSPIPSVLRVS